MTWGEVAQLITAAVVAASYVRGELRGRQLTAKVDGVKAHVEKVEHATNGLSARNEAIAKKLGIEEGKAAEKANPSK